MLSAQLPLELTNMIIDHLHDTNDDTVRRTLAACSLVCRAWVTESRFHLFRKVWLSPARVAAFLSMLVHPRCTIPLRFIRHLHMRPVDRRAWREDSSLEQLLAWVAPWGLKLEPALGRLSKLTLHFVHWCKLGPPSRRTLLDGFKGVTFLDLVVHRFPKDTTLTGVLRSFPALRDLELGYLEREYAPTVPDEGPLPAGLRTLKLKGTPETFVDELVRAGPYNALRTLKLIERNASRFSSRKLAAIARFLAVIGPALHTLELRARHAPHNLPPTMRPAAFADALGHEACTELRRLSVQGLDEELAPALLGCISSNELGRLEFSLIGGPDRAAFDALAVDWAGLSATLALPRFMRTRLVVHVPTHLPAMAPAMEGDGMMEADEPMGPPLPMLREDVDGESSGRGDDLDYVRQRLEEVLRDTAARNMLQID